MTWLTLKLRAGPRQERVKIDTPPVKQREDSQTWGLGGYPTLRHPRCPNHGVAEGIMRPSIVDPSPTLYAGLVM